MKEVVLLLRKDLMELLGIVRSDPKISGELPVVRRLATRALLWLVATEFFLVLQVYPVKYFFDEVSSESPSVTKLMLISLSLLIVYKIGSMFRARMSFWRNSTQWRMWRVWWGYGHRRELRLSADWHTAHGTGEKDSMVAKNIIKFEAMINELVFDTIPAVLRIFFTTIFMFTIGWVYGLISILTIVAYVLLVRRSERILDPLRTDFRESLKKIERFGTEITKNWRTIKEIGREEDFCDQNDELLLNFCHEEDPRHRAYTKCMLRQEDVLTVSRYTLYGMIGLSLLWGDQSVGSVGALVLATTWMERSYSNFGRFADFQMRMNEGLASLRELVALMCLPPTIVQASEPAWPAELRGGITFQKVGFRYPDASECALSGVDFVVEPYTATALVGSSGCGKSTLMGLLQRLHDPSEGSVLIDGIDLRQLDYDRYRREAISVVSQGIELFDTTIMENIRVSHPAANDDEVYEAARLAYADEFIEKQEHGYQTEVGENGIRLSGGQKQRIAIARALLRKPAILIMDEATSALDALSQKKVQESINQLIERRECTIIIIAHRFSTIMSADQVVVLDDGTVAEIGTHEQLNRKNGLYARLRQMEGDGLLD